MKTLLAYILRRKELGILRRRIKNQRRELSMLNRRHDELWASWARVFRELEAVRRSNLSDIAMRQEDARRYRGYIRLLDDIKADIRRERQA